MASGDPLDAGQTLPCYMVNSLINDSEQCNFILQNDCLEEEAFDYVYFVYCVMGNELRYISIILVISLIIVFFLTLSVIADEFLCPSLLAIAKSLRMSDNLAGITLLAFGNGCPDIFSSLAAASNGKAELIVSELLGAGIFCLSIVAGLIFIKLDFRLAYRPLLRDTIFYLFAVYFCWLICWSEQITFYHALAFILIYVIYLTVAVGGQAIHSRFQFCRHETSKLTSGSTKQPLPPPSPVTTTTNNNNEQQTIIPTHCNNNNNHHKLTLSSGTGSCFSINTNASNLSSSDLLPEWRTFMSTANVNAIANNNLNNNQDGDATNPSNELDDLLEHINPIDVENWSQASVLRRFIILIRAPFLFIALTTVPVVDHDKKRSNWCRLLNSFHCISIPLVIFICTRGVVSRTDNNNQDNNQHSPNDDNESSSSCGDFCQEFLYYYPFLLILLGLMLASYILFTTKAHTRPRYHLLFAYLGFIMSILWVYMLVTEILGLLKTIGIIFSMTDAAIGLAFLAWGNSLGDIVANLALAEAGYPRMAIGASIGAPLLNLLIGFGVSFALSLNPDEAATIKYTPTISLLCASLATIIISLMLCSLVPPGYSKKPFGYLLICAYIIYFILAICLEFNLIKFN